MPELSLPVFFFRILFSEHAFMSEKSLKAVHTQTWTAFSIFIVMVGTEGLEPSRAQCSTDFKSVASTSSATIPDKMEVPVGVEPTITELQSVALATWLRNHFVNACSYYHPDGVGSTGNFESFSDFRKFLKSPGIADLKTGFCLTGGMEENHAAKRRNGKETVFTGVCDPNVI